MLAHISKQHIKFARSFMKLVSFPENPHSSDIFGGYHI